MEPHQPRTAAGLSRQKRRPPVQMWQPALPQLEAKPGPLLPPPLAGLRHLDLSHLLPLRAAEQLRVLLLQAAWIGRALLQAAGTSRALRGALPLW